MTRAVLVVFYTLTASFLVVAGVILIPTLRGNISFLYLAILGILMFVLGIALIILAVKQKLEKKLKRYLLLTGASAVGLFAGTILHNFFYALEVVTKDLSLLSKLMGIISAAFFIISLFIAPIGFLIGAIGTAMLLFGNKQKK